MNAAVLLLLYIDIMSVADPILIQIQKRAYSNPDSLWIYYKKSSFSDQYSLNPGPDPAINLNPDPGEETPESGSKLFLNTVWK